MALVILVFILEPVSVFTAMPNIFSDI